MSFPGLSFEEWLEWQLEDPEFREAFEKRQRVLEERMTMKRLLEKVEAMTEEQRQRQLESLARGLMPMTGMPWSDNEEARQNGGKNKESPEAAASEPSDNSSD